MSVSIRAASLAALAIAMATPVFAQAAPQTTPMASPPRTADGQPDFGGFWTNQSITSLTRDPKKIPNLVLTPKEAADLEYNYVWNVNTRNQLAPTDDKKQSPKLGERGGGVNAFWMDVGRHYATVKGEIRGSWLIDPPNGQLPVKPKPEPVKADTNSTYGQYGSFDGPETRPLSERCIVFGGQSGPVMQNSGYNNNFQFMQTPDHLVINAEMIHDTRIIPIFKDRSQAKHRSDGITPWFGDQVAWYEGDTLVIQTTGVNPKQKSLMSPTGKLTERLTRWNDNEILYEFAVDDPELYTRPWKGEMMFRKAESRPYEYACHEGNYAIGGILQGARVQEAQGKVVQNNAAGE